MAKSTTKKKTAPKATKSTAKSATAKKPATKKASKPKGFDAKAKARLESMAVSKIYRRNDLETVAKEILGECDCECFSPRQIAFTTKGDRCPSKGYFSVV